MQEYLTHSSTLWQDMGQRAQADDRDEEASSLADHWCNHVRSLGRRACWVQGFPTRTGVGERSSSSILGGGGACPPFSDDERRCPGLLSWSLRRMARSEGLGRLNGKINADPCLAALDTECLPYGARTGPDTGLSAVLLEPENVLTGEYSLSLHGL